MESPLSPAEVQSVLSSGREPFANRTFEGAVLKVTLQEGETGAEHLLEGAGGEVRGYRLL